MALILTGESEPVPHACSSGMPRKHGLCAKQCFPTLAVNEKEAHVIPNKSQG